MATTSAAPKGLQIDQIQIDPPAAAVPPQSVSLAPDVQKKLYAETDARFAAKTGVARKLDPHNKVDQALIPAWFHIYQGVLAEYKGGKIHWTTDHLPVQKALASASDETAKAEQYVDLAAAPGAALGEHASAAKAAFDAAATSHRKAAAMMPADPHLAQILAHLDLGAALAWILVGQGDVGGRRRDAAGAGRAHVRRDGDGHRAAGPRRVVGGHARGGQGWRARPPPAVGRVSGRVRRVRRRRRDSRRRGSDRHRGDQERERDRERERV